MDQLKLDLNVKHRKTLLVDTIAVKHLHKERSNIINIGYEYAAEALDADMCHWQDIVDVSLYDTIGFSVIYPLYVLNIVPFLRRHNIEPIAKKRTSHKIVAGGPGVSNLNNALAEIADYTFLGEADGDFTDSSGWCRKSVLTTKPIMRNNRAIVELTRGCKYRCKFCEYAHVLGGLYREKPLDLAVSQINECLSRGIRRVILRTANLPGYSRLDELLDCCCKGKIYQGWSDVAVLDADRILPWLTPLRITAPKIGVESFDEATRKRIGKFFSDDKLNHVFDELMKRCSLLHVYLIYGLPDDNYDEWFKWAEILAKKRENYDHNIRVDFSITNFNPCRNTPMQNAAWVNFDAKHAFLRRWIEHMRDVGFYKRNWNVWYGRDYGRHGRKEAAYSMVMKIRHAEPDYLTPRLVNALPNGVGRSTSDREALRFLNYDFSEK